MPGSRLVYAPAVANPERLTDLIARAAFHFHHVHPQAIRFLVTHDVLDDAHAAADAFAVPAGLDPAIAAHHDRVRDAIEVVAGGGTDPAREVAAADWVLVWDRVAVAADPAWRAALEGVTPLAVDAARDRLEGSAYADLAATLHPASRRMLHASRLRFADWAAELGGADVAYLLGTGPSIEEHGRFAFDGLVIACNTTILDDALMRHARPRLLTFADPVFHFGVSGYAAAFRAALATAAEKHDLRLVIPSKYGHLLASLQPDLAERTVIVPLLARSVPNLDLSTRFEVRTTENVLTLLQLPLATTLARDVHLIGYDGRNPGDDYFWQHSPRTQDHDLLATARRVHPGFFTVDYRDYYERHVADLEAHLLTAEAAGHRVRSLTPSHVPALRRRTVGAGPPAVAAPPSDAAFVVASVNPDRVDDFGHYGQFDRVVGRAAEAAGGTLVSLVSRGRSPATGEVPVFTHPTWAGAHGPPAAFAASFAEELGAALGRLVEAAPGIPLHVLMYTADLWHVPALLRTAWELRDASVTFDVNLLRAHDEILQAAAVRAPDSAAAALLGEAQRLGSALGVRVHADTNELAAAWSAVTGLRPPVWPMFGVTDLPPPGPTPHRPPAGRALRAYSPATMQAAKGYDVVAAATELLGGGADIQIVARDLPMPTGTPAAMASAAAALRTAGAELVDGVLTSAAYAAQLEAADIVLIPYRVDPFRTRTSAVFADAVRLMRPVVVTAGTWAGALTEELGIGVTFRDGDPADLSRALRTVANDYARYAERAHEVAPMWLATHHPGALIDTIRQPGDGASDAGGAEHRIDLLTRLVRRSGPTTDVGPVVAALDARVLELEAALEASGIDVLTVELAAVQARDRRIAQLEHDNAQLRQAFRNRAWNALKRAATAGARGLSRGWPRRDG